MTDDRERNTGEISRAVDRIELALVQLQADTRVRFDDLVTRMNAVVSPITTHAYQIENQQKAIDHLTAEVERISTTAARVSGAIGALTMAATMILNWLLRKR